MEKLSWNRKNLGSHVVHSIKRNTCLHQVFINEHEDKIEIEINIAPKSFQTLNIALAGCSRIETNLYAGRMRIVEVMPTGRNIKETKRKAKLWHEQIKGYKL